MSENVEDQEFVIGDEVKKTIEAKVKTLQKKHGKIQVIAVAGMEGDDKELYVAYMKKASIASFSRFTSKAKSDEVLAAKGLCDDLFVAGDKELLEDDELFMFGLMPQLDQIMKIRQSKVINF